jgi:hypothetical protein
MAAVLRGQLLSRAAAAARGTWHLAPTVRASFSSAGPSANAAASVRVTERAAKVGVDAWSAPDPARPLQRINELCKKREVPSALRVLVEGGGCSGFRYKFQVENTFDKDDV